MRRLINLIPKRDKLLKNLKKPKIILLKIVFISFVMYKITLKIDVQNNI